MPSINRKPDRSKIVLVIATRNAHKAQEICTILGTQFQYRTLNDLPDAPAVVEDAPDFSGNASKKARELANYLAERRLTERESPSMVYVLADDSGLEVDALGGAPGVHSARFAALDATPGHKSGNAPDAENNAKLLRLLAEKPLGQRTARFRCVLALAPVRKTTPGARGKQNSIQDIELFEGKCEGRIAFVPKGHNGFGYDPLFIPVGQEKSFAELGEEIKNAMSHRARALARLKEWLKGKV